MSCNKVHANQSSQELTGKVRNLNKQELQTKIMMVALGALMMLSMMHGIPLNPFMIGLFGVGAIVMGTHRLYVLNKMKDKELEGKEETKEMQYHLEDLRDNFFRDLKKMESTALSVLFPKRMKIV